MSRSRTRSGAVRERGASGEVLLQRSKQGINRERLGQEAVEGRAILGLASRAHQHHRDQRCLGLRAATAGEYHCASSVA